MEGMTNDTKGADPWEKMEVTFSHFSWLNKEVLRLGDEARSYATLCRELQVKNASLQAEVDRLNAAIISGGAIVPDAKPQEDSR
jgi:hypothetical protein